MQNPWAVGILAVGIGVGYFAQHVMRRDATSRRESGIRPFVSGRAWLWMGVCFALLAAAVIVAWSSGDLLSRA